MTPKYVVTEWNNRLDCEVDVAEFDTHEAAESFVNSSQGLQDPLVYTVWLS